MAEMAYFTVCGSPGMSEQEAREAFRLVRKTLRVWGCELMEPAPEMVEESPLGKWHAHMLLDLVSCPSLDELGALVEEFGLGAWHLERCRPQVVAEYLLKPEGVA